MKYGFVILHYLTDTDTLECIDSILERFHDADYEIVVVDNHSGNGSIERIREKTESYQKIHILYNEENLGFARGNNVGYVYCKKTLNCDFIFVLNNDIVLNTDNLLVYAEEDWEQRDAAVIGPDIESLADRGHQNPMGKGNTTKSAIRKSILRYQLLLLLNKIGLYDLILQFKKNTSDSTPNVKTRVERMLTGYQLHGAFMIFTPTFVKKMDEAFCAETFMYMEESILFQICKQSGFKTIYDPRMVVYHKEDSATDALNIKNRDKRTFVFSNIIKSSRILLKYLR